jgi:phosphonate transport system substrate-binding protein
VSRSHTRRTAPRARRALLGRLLALPAWALATNAQAVPALGAQAAAAPGALTPLRVGVIPYLPPATTVRQFQPLREHLASTLQRPVQVFTAADFRALAASARDGRYDLVSLPIHLARMAAMDWNHRIVARTAGPPVQVILLTLRERPLAAPAELRGEKVGAFDAISITALLLQRWLVGQDLVPGRDVTVDMLRTVAGVLIALDRGEIRAAAVARSHIVHLTREQMRQYAIAATLGDAGRLLWTTPPTVPAAESDRIRDALLAYDNPVEIARGGPAHSFEATSLRDTDSAERLTVEARRLLAQN